MITFDTRTANERKHNSFNMVCVVVEGREVKSIKKTPLGGGVCDNSLGFWSILEHVCK